MANLFDLNATPEQSGLAFPASLTEKYRPVEIDSFIGLDKVKRILSKFSANPRENMAFLFLGPSGVGKTTMALALARRLRAELHHVPSQECNLETIERVRRTCQYVPRSGCSMHLVLIDEADRMTDAAQVSLLSKLDTTNFPPNTVFVFTANATDRLEARFLSRLLTLEFSSYGLAKDAASLLETVWTAETGDNPERPNFARLVKDSNNNVREALMRLETEILAS
jgi:replication-associated recombination protein RarA